ncbi:MAG: polyprenyl synthetase family protein [Treponema sp.]|nr:polyprenyl synthetase family protein [Treponema sp.]
MDQEYTQRLVKIETELKRWLPEWPSSNQPDVTATDTALTGLSWAEKIFPGIGQKTSAETAQALTEPLSDMLSRGGKRWRPLLMTLVCETLGGGDSAIPLSPVVEFSHNASLIHDDIEDDSDERRGKPAIHKTYGIDTAINSASFLYFLSASCIESPTLPANIIKNREQIYRLWTDCMRKLHLGQAMDINWHRNISFVPGIEEYYLMCAMKTGSLADFAAELGALCANAPQETARLFGEAAGKMGIGFQILDDVYNLTTGIPGKKRGDDVVEGKKGLPILLYMQKYPEKRDKVFYCFHVAKTEGTNAPEVDELIDMLTASGVFEEAKEKGLSYLTETRDIFGSSDYTGCSVNENSRALLNGFIKLIS